MGFEPKLLSPYPLGYMRSYRQMNIAHGKIQFSPMFVGQSTKHVVINDKWHCNFRRFRTLIPFKKGAAQKLILQCTTSVKTIKIDVCCTQHGVADGGSAAVAVGCDFP